MKIISNKSPQIRLTQLIQKLNVLDWLFNTSIFLLFLTLLCSCVTLGYQKTIVRCDITSDPSDAQIYAGTSPDNLRYIGQTPWTRRVYQTHPAWQAKYYQFKKRGYEWTDIIFVAQDPANQNRYVHVKLKPKFKEPETV